MVLVKGATNTPRWMWNSVAAIKQAAALRL
jgi:hypothetical protein